MTSINGLSIYDIHFHCGRWRVNQSSTIERNSHTASPSVLRNFLAQDTLDILNKPLNEEKDILKKVFISNLDCIAHNELTPSKFLQDEFEGNSALINKYKNSPNTAFYAVCQPGVGDVKNIEKLFEKYPQKFVGLKFHPPALNLQASDSKYEPYLEYAKKHKLPCLFHSGVAIDWSNGVGKIIENKNNWDKSDPRFIYSLAKKFKDVPIILGHTGAGGSPAHNLAINVLFESIDKKDANLIAEISWMDFTPDGKPSDNPETLIKLIKGLKERNALDKIVFGTDAPLGCYGETAKNPADVFDAYSSTVNKIKKAITKNFPEDSKEIIDKLFNKNAENLFKQNENKIETIIKEQSVKIKSSKAGYVVVSVLAVIGAIIFVGKKYVTNIKSRN